MPEELDTSKNPQQVFKGKISHPPSIPNPPFISNPQPIPDFPSDSPSKPIPKPSQDEALIPIKADPIPKKTPSPNAKISKFESPSGVKNTQQPLPDLPPLGKPKAKLNIDFSLPMPSNKEKPIPEIQHDEPKSKEEEKVSLSTQYRKLCLDLLQRRC